MAVAAGCGSTGREAGRRHAGADVAAPRLLWRDPGPIGARDLSWPDVSAHPRPVAPFTFVKENLNDTRAKVEVTDAAGAKWDVKLAGNWDDSAETHAEVAAGRLTWALGYFIQDTVFIADGVVSGINTPLKRAARGLTADGHFSGARFEERRSAALDQHWSLAKNPFVGTRELSGLEILSTMVNNWDLGGENNFKILRVKAGDGGTGEELRYIISDFGASFGRMATEYWPWSMVTPRRWSKWNVADYQQQAFIDGVEGGALLLHYRGYGGIRRVPLEHARWFSGLVGQLTPAQVHTAFAQAGATPEEADAFSARFLEKVHELASVVAAK